MAYCDDTNSENLRIACLNAPHIKNVKREFMMKMKALGAAVLASSFALPAFAADTITFDADGVGGANGDQVIGAFDWAAGSTLSDDSIPATQGSDFDTYSHGSLIGFLDGAGDPAGSPTGLNTAGTGFEITFISGFTETISAISTDAAVIQNDGGDGVGGGNDVYTFDQTVTLADAGTQNVNFFQIYYDDLSDGSGLKSSSLAGTGYGDGLKILDANVGVVSGNFTTTFEFVDVNNNGTFDPGTDTLQGFIILDQSSNGDDWAGQLSVEGEGATTLQADVFYQDNNFFKSDISSLLADLFFNTSNVLPFQETNPSQSFDDGSGGTITPSLGLVNGLLGPDILFQTDANNSFVKTVPEPGSMFLLGMGLFTLGMARRRRTGELTQA